MREDQANLQREGGDCQMIEIDRSTVMLRPTGACMLFAHPAATLAGIQAPSRNAAANSFA
ncbi:hypothetical protein EOW77_0033355 [Bradyrhizobium yuanmingense]|nr:hypothetical protein EOW77_0033355 [Bradyrhizobium yuanmingense]